MKTRSFSKQLLLLVLAVAAAAAAAAPAAPKSPAASAAAVAVAAPAAARAAPAAALPKAAASAAAAAASADDDDNDDGDGDEFAGFYGLAPTLLWTRPTPSPATWPDYCRALGAVARYAGSVLVVVALGRLALALFSCSGWLLPVACAACGVVAHLACMRCGALPSAADVALAARLGLMLVRTLIATCACFSASSLGFAALSEATGFYIDVSYGLYDDFNVVRSVVDRACAFLAAARLYAFLRRQGASVHQLLGRLLPQSVLQVGYFTGILYIIHCISSLEIVPEISIALDYERVHAAGWSLILALFVSPLGAFTLSLRDAPAVQMVALTAASMFFIKPETLLPAEASAERPHASKRRRVLVVVFLVLYHACCAITPEASMQIAVKGAALVAIVSPLHYGRTLLTSLVDLLAPFVVLRPEELASEDSAALRLRVELARFAKARDRLAKEFALRIAPIAAEIPTISVYLVEAAASLAAEPERCAALLVLIAPAAPAGQPLTLRFLAGLLPAGALRAASFLLAPLVAGGGAGQVALIVLCPPLVLFSAWRAGALFGASLSLVDAPKAILLLAVVVLVAWVPALTCFMCVARGGVTVAFF